MQLGKDGTKVERFAVRYVLAPTDRLTDLGGVQDHAEGVGRHHVVDSPRLGAALLGVTALARSGQERP